MSKRAKTAKKFPSAKYLRDRIAVLHSIAEILGILAEEHLKRAGVARAKIAELEAQLKKI